MPPSTATQFGTLLREFRERAGLTQLQLAEHLAIGKSRVSKLETGVSAPPQDPQFYDRLQAVPEFSDSDITCLSIVSSNTAWDYEPPKEPQDLRPEVLTQTMRTILPSYPQSGRVEEAHVPITKFVHTDPTGLATLSKRSPSIILDRPPVLVPIPEFPDHYPHTNVPEHGRWVVAEEKFQEAKAGKRGGVVFDSSQAKLLFEALEDPNHQYRQRAVQLVRRFNKAVEKEKAQPHIQERGIVIQQASEKYGISATILREWKELGLIPVLYKGKAKQGIYLDEEAVARAVSVYNEAKQKGIQPTRFLKAELAQQTEKHPQLAQGITANSAAREFNVPTNFLLRWAKELGVIPIVSEGTGAGSATYLDREKAREVAELYHEAKRRRIQPKKLLEQMSSG
jgi:transcriptional regulator with XRE-family HTH domain